MAYTKQDWKDFPNETTPITAERMNHIEEGIYNTLNEIINIMCPVGTYYETSDLNFDPNVMWGGTWELDEDGTVLVSKSSVSGSKFNVDLGTIVGEETHTLTIDEMPRHLGHVMGRLTTFLPQAGNGIAGTSNPEDIGGGKAHNNVQPSKVVNRWHRTA